MANRVAIVGIGQTYHQGKRPDVNLVEMINEAVRAALDDAGLTLKDIDTVLSGSMELFEGHYSPDMWAVEGLGAFMKEGMFLSCGGTTGASVTSAAFFHVASGHCDTALAVCWQKHHEGDARAGLRSAPYWYRELMTGPIGNFARRAQLYMASSGAQEEHGALMRVKADQGAMKNPYAHLRLGLTVEDVMKSRLLVYPLRLLHMCPDSSGACALVVASAERARKITPKPVWVEDWEVAHGGGIGYYWENPERSYLEPLSRRIYKANGILNPAKEIDVFELYTPSAWSEFNWIEEAGLCRKGEAWKLLEKGTFGLDGEIPTNPSGSVVCTNPIGASPVLRIAEAALQVRGDAGEHQVSRPVERAMATAYGGAGEQVITLLRKSL